MGAQGSARVKNCICHCQRGGGRHVIQALSEEPQREGGGQTA